MRVSPAQPATPLTLIRPSHLSTKWVFPNSLSESTSKRASPGLSSINKIWMNSLMIFAFRKFCGGKPEILHGAHRCQVTFMIELLDQVGVGVEVVGLLYVLLGLGGGQNENRAEGKLEEMG